MDDSSEKLILFRLEAQDKAAESNRTEVKQALVDVAEKADVYRKEVKDSLVRVYDQVSRTNGRVSFLEKWMYTCTGGMIVITSLIGWYLAFRK